MTQGQPTDSPARVAVVGKAKHTALLLLGATGVLLVAAFLGLLMLILLTVLFTLGKARFRLQPAPLSDKPVFLETFALWCVAYTLLFLTMAWLKISSSLLATELIVLVATLAVALWPMARGMSWEQLWPIAGLEYRRWVLH